jgi:hypothetical protein
MRFPTLFYAVKARSASVLKRHPLLHLAAVPLLGALVIPIIAWAQAQPAPPLSGVLGRSSLLPAARSTLRQLQALSTL